MKLRVSALDHNSDVRGESDAAEGVEITWNVKIANKKAAGYVYDLTLQSRWKRLSGFIYDD